jgi:hypothetical protein
LGKCFAAFGPEIRSNGDTSISLFFNKNLKKPFAEDKCLWILFGLLLDVNRFPIQLEHTDSVASEYEFIFNSFK